METKEWLAKALKIEKEEIKRLFEEETSRNFFLVWTVFERINFDKFVKLEKIKEFSKKDFEIDNELEEILKKFHLRYQDEKLRKNLCYKNKCNNKECNIFSECEFYILCNKEYKDIEKDEKIYFLTYIVYRYRNNMFHGNKGLESWLQFEEQIKDCITVMKKLTVLPDKKDGEENEE